MVYFCKIYEYSLFYKLFLKSLYFGISLVNLGYFSNGNPIFLVKNEFLNPKKPYVAVLGIKIGQETAEK